MKDSLATKELTVDLVIQRCSPPHGSLRLAKALHPLICIAFAVVLAGCSSVKTHVDKGQLQARTFSFLNAGSRTMPNYADTSEQALAIIQQAIVKNLTARGLNKLPSGGDVTVAYLLIIGNNGETTSLNDYFGYTDDASALVDEVHKQDTEKSKARGYFEAGTLVVDVLNPSTSKLLQRRSIQAQVLRNLSAEARGERVQAIVDQVLGDIPIAP